MLTLHSKLPLDPIICARYASKSTEELRRGSAVGSAMQNANERDSAVCVEHDEGTTVANSSTIQIGTRQLFIQGNAEMMRSIGARININ